MLIAQVLPGIDDSMHIGLHEICYYVYVFVPRRRRWPLYVYEPNHILVIKELQKFNLSYDPFCINQILKCFRYFLYGNLLLERAIQG